MADIFDEVLAEGEGDVFDELIAEREQSTLRLAEPRQPTTPSTTAGGPPKTLAGFRETVSGAFPGATESFLGEPPEIAPVSPEYPPSTLERAFARMSPGGAVLSMVNPDLAAQFNRTMANQVIGLNRFITSPLGIGAGAVGRIVPTLVSLGFTADMANSLYEQAKQTIPNWDKLTDTERLDAVVNMAATAGMAGMAGVPAAGGIRRQLAKLAAAPAPEQRPVWGERLAMPPGARAPRAEPTEIERLMPEQAAAQAEAMTQRATAAVEEPKTAPAPAISAESANWLQAYNGGTIRAFHGGTGTLDPKRPMFLSFEPMGAEWYAGERGKETPTIIQADVSINKPARRADIEAAAKAVKATPKDVSKASPYSGTEVIDYVYVPEVVAELKRRGFDGVIENDVLENGEILAVIPFDASQIKEVSRKIGTRSYAGVEYGEWQVPVKDFYGDLKKREAEEDAKAVLRFEQSDYRPAIKLKDGRVIVSRHHLEGHGELTALFPGEVAERGFVQRSTDKFITSLEVARIEQAKAKPEPETERAEYDKESERRLAGGEPPDREELRNVPEQEGGPTQAQADKTVPIVPKEHWQMTQDEYATFAAKKRKKSGLDKDVSEEDVAAVIKNTPFHYNRVKQALREGKPVPAEVLAEYPDLAKPIPTPAPVQAKPVVPKAIHRDLGGEPVESSTPEVGRQYFKQDADGHWYRVSYGGVTGRFDQHQIVEWTWLEGPNKGTKSTQYGQSAFYVAKKQIPEPYVPSGKGIVTDRFQTQIELKETRSAARNATGSIRQRLNEKARLLAAKLKNIDDYAAATEAAKRPSPPPPAAAPAKVPEPSAKPSKPSKSEWQIRKAAEWTEYILAKEAGKVEPQPAIPEAKPETKAAEPVPAPPAPSEPAQAVQKVQTEVQAVAKTEGQRPAKEVKSELIERLEKAMAEAPSIPNLSEVRKTQREFHEEKDNSLHWRTWSEKEKKEWRQKMAEHNDAILLLENAKTVTIEIPGDGTFTVPNIREIIGDLLDRAKKISTKSEPKKAPENKPRLTKYDWAFTEEEWQKPETIEFLEKQLKRPLTEESRKQIQTAIQQAKRLQEATYTPEPPPEAKPAEPRKENLLITPRTDGMVTLEDSKGSRIGTFKTAEEAAAAAKELGYGIAAGSPLKPKPPEAKPAEPVGGPQGAVSVAPQQLTPITPTVPVLAPKPLSQIIRDLSKGLNIPIRFGRLINRYAGYFMPVRNYIASKKPNQIPVVSHEVGHKLDDAFKFSTDPAIRAEVEVLGDNQTPGSMSSWTKSKNLKYKQGEGVAEFVRYWLTDPSHAQQAAPNLNALFERIMDANPDFGAVMRQARTDIQTWRASPSEARLASSISTSNPIPAHWGFDNLMRDVVDDLHFVRLAVEWAKEHGTVSAARNPYVLARLLRGSYGMASTFIRRGIVDFNTRQVQMGTSLENALEPVAGRIAAFRNWIVAKHAAELRAQGRETGLVSQDIDEVLQKYNQEPGFQDAFNKIKAWQDSLLKYGVDARLLSPEARAAMRQMYEDYVPFQRVMEVGAGEAPAEQGAGIGRGLNLGKPGSLKAQHGSKRDIIDPLETMIRNAYAIVTASEKNNIALALADMAKMPDMGRWVERVATPKELVKVQFEKLREQLEDAGADVQAIPDDLLLSFYRQGKRAPYGENTIMVNRGGKMEFYRLDKDLFETFHALDQDSAGQLIRMLSAPGQLLRSGVTLTADFATFNAIRDTVSAAIISRYSVFPFYGTLRGIAALMRNPQLVAEWAASGGRQAIEVSYFDRAKLQRFLTEKITKDLTPKEQALVYLKSPLTALRLLTGTLEEATRIGEYQIVFERLRKQGVPEGEARRMAAFEARDLQDFAKGGAKTKAVRETVPFWNAKLQGNIRLAQAFRERPAQTIIKGLAWVTIPKLLEQAVNWDDPDYWDRPQWERDLFFLIPFGQDENGRTQFIRLPTPFEVGIIFGTVPGRFLQYLHDQNSEAGKGLFWQLLTNTVPNPLPQSILTLLETVMGKQGYSLWRGRPIVPESLKDEAPELQFTAQQSLTAKKVGAMLGVSPAKVDYLIQGTTGGLGKQIVHKGIDPAIWFFTGDERTAMRTGPLSRFVTTPAGTQSDAVERFYFALNRARADVSRKKAGRPTDGFENDADMLEKAARAMGDLRKKARQASTQKERQQYQLQIADLARKSLAIRKKR